jgi:HEAT repeat protein
MSIAETLVAVGAEPAAVTPILAVLLYDGDDSVSWKAGKLLVQIDPEEARRKVVLLIPKLRGDDGSVNVTVLNQLLSLGPEAGEAVPVLIELLHSEEPRVFTTTVNLLGMIGPGAAAALPLLVEALGRGTLDDPQRCQVVRALGQMGPAAGSAVPVLLDAITSAANAGPAANSDPYGSNWGITFRTAAIEAVVAAGGDNAVVLPALRGQLASESWRVRAAAIRCLARLAGDSADMQNDLAALLADEDPLVRANAALAIGSMTANRPGAVERLVTALEDHDPFVRTAAAAALEKIGPDARAALPALHDALHDDMNTLPNHGHPQSNVRRGIMYPTNEYLPELLHLSVAQAVRKAVVAIDADD